LKKTKTDQTAYTGQNFCQSCAYFDLYAVYLDHQVLLLFVLLCVDHFMRCTLYVLCVYVLCLSGQCSVPTVLCCAGHDNSCYRGCFCDEACILIGDCCPDYQQTCIQCKT